MSFFRAEQSADLLKRGFTRRDLGRLATVITAGAALPFYNERALAQLSMVRDMPADAVKINANENPMGPCPEAAEAIHNVVRKGGRYMYEETFTLKDTLAQVCGVKREYVTPYAGSSDPLHRAVLSYCSKERPFVKADPGYEAGERAARFIGAKTVNVALRKGTWNHDVKAMLAAHPSPGIVYVCNPNNPTGTGISLTAVERIVRRAAHAVVLIDEAYYEFCGVTAMRNLLRSPNLFVSRTFSKVYGMAAMRMGCLFSQASNIAYLHKAQSPYSVNSLAALAAKEAVKDTGYVTHYVTEVLAARELLCYGLEKLGIPYTPSSANFVLGHFGARAIEIRDALRGRAILVRDRSYEIPGAVRITVGTREQTQRVLDELSRLW